MHAGLAEDSDLEGFWQGALQAADLPQAVPHERWELQRCYAPGAEVGKMYVRHASYLRDVAAFDAAAFRCTALL